MPDSAPYRAQPTAEAGTGLFATRDIAEGEVIWEEERPLLAVLDSARLKEACSWCFTYVGEKNETGATLKVCTGCKILRFCDVKCQTAAWKHSHKLECKIYCKLYPAVLPNTARMGVQLLLRRKASLMTQTELDEFLALQHHLDDFKRNTRPDDDKYQNLQLMARAAQEYSGTGDNLGQVETIAGRILINTLTLPTPLYTPIGLAISLKSSLLNHSCAPNTVHVFSGAGSVLRANTAIAVGTELTTSYIDSSFPQVVRRSELSERYFFHCKCSACSSDQTLGWPDPPSSLTKLPQIELKKLLDLEDSAAQFLLGATGQNSAVALPQLARAFMKFSLRPATMVHYPPWRQPLAKIRAELILTLLALKRWVPALILSMVQNLRADTVTYSSPTHPVRVARLWVLARLVGQVGAQANEGSSDPSSELFGEIEAAKALADRFQIEWGVLVWALVSDVASKVTQSHGQKNSLTKDVLLEFQQLRDEMRRMGGTEPSADTLKPVWERLQEITKSGWDWWREWERNRILHTGKLIAEGDMKGILEGMEILYGNDPD